MHNIIMCDIVGGSLSAGKIQIKKQKAEADELLDLRKRFKELAAAQKEAQVLLIFVVFCIVSEQSNHLQNIILKL